MYRYIYKLLHYINLESDIDDFETIHKNIEKDITFKGTNLWILAFAIIVASVGLNMNSTAVIIGAMLISPLMGPIIGIGYSIATYDFLLLTKSLKNFLFAIIASLIASTAYFMLSPIYTAHSELLARTSPSIYDVIIALFGGLAGIIAISSKHKGNVIPGVAIATALMPPLCTTGYGIATGQLNYFLGAFYLFIINSVFIAIASMIISKLLNFPLKGIVSKPHKKRLNRIIISIIIIVLIPSIYLGYKLVQKEKFTTNSNKFINNVNTIDNSYLLKYDINPTQKIIKLTYGGQPLTKEQQKNILQKALDFSLEKATIEFTQIIPNNDLTQSNNIQHYQNEINNLKILLQQKNLQLDSLKNKNLIGQEIFKELQVLYPQIVNFIYGETYKYENINNKNTPDKLNLIIIKTNSILPKIDKIKIETWLSIKLKSQNIKLIFEEN